MTPRHRKDHAAIANRLKRLEDPAILTGHLGIVLTESRLLSWHVARMDLAQHRMTFPWTGSEVAHDLGAGHLTEALLRCATRAWDEQHPGLF